MNIEEKIFATGFFGLVVGVFVGFAGGLGVSKAVGPGIEKSVIYQRENNKPSIMRHYKTGADQIMVEDSKNKGVYIPLTEYLRNIQDVNTTSQNVKKAEIEKAVEWYK